MTCEACRATGEGMIIECASDFERFAAHDRSRPAQAWGDDGHKTIALIAEQYLEPAVKTKIAAMLAADPDSLTSHDLASEASWADKYRDSNNRRDHYEQTQNWHFVDLEINDPDMKVACFGRAPLPPGTLASNGPAKACIVDKITQFLAELKNPKTDFEERLIALKFLLHFVGDVHQPLHTADNHDRGSNEVKRCGAVPRLWHSTLSAGETQQLDRAYVERAKVDVGLQLSRAGVRLAHLLNQALK